MADGIEAKMGTLVVHATVLEPAKQYMLDVLAGELTYAKHIAVGTGAPTVSSLGNEVARRSVFEVEAAATGSTERTWRAFFEADYPAVDRTISEAALFGNSSATIGSGTCIAASVVSPTVLKRTGRDTLFIDYKLFFT